jgi:hypothetical protein
MAVHDERIAMKPSSVVSRIISADTPSTPKWYSTPMLGIQAPFSTNWKPAAPRSKRNHRGRLMRKPTSAVPFANQRTRSSCPRKAGSNSTSAPRSGVYVMIESR